MVFAADRAFNDLLRNYGKQAVVDNLLLIEAWSLGVTDRLPVGVPDSDGMLSERLHGPR